MTNVGQRIKSARLAMHPLVTQRAVAQRLHLSPSAINLWERGKTEPRPAELAELARWFGVSTDWLLGVDLTPPSKAVRQGPPLWTVPVVPASCLTTWRWSAVTEMLQTAIAYPPRTAAGVLVASDALTSAAPAGAYAVVSKSHVVAPNSIVFAAVSKAGEPVLRRFVTDGGNQLLVADDARWPTVRLQDGVRIIGTVTEITIRRCFV
jgi:transcriptional regulator with XRE-family HTH domain